jgi:hypothetical protein
MKYSLPRLVMAEIILHRNRCPVPRMTGVFPLRPYVVSQWWSERIPISSPQ